MPSPIVVTGREGEGSALTVGGCADPLVVPTEELARVLGGWMREHDADHPANDPDDRRLRLRGVQEGTETTALQYLSEWVGLSPRVFYRILSGEQTWTSLATADLILTRIESPALSDGRILVHPNPHWSRRRWDAWSAAAASGVPCTFTRAGSWRRRRPARST